MQWNFRQAENKDSEAIIKLVESAYRGDSSRQGWTSEADLLDGGRTFTEEVQGIISAPLNKIILLEDTDKLLASVHVKKLNNDETNSKSSRAYLGMFAVEPKSQNIGIGRAVMNYAEKYVEEEWDCTEVEMAVIRQRVELIAWYEKLGYQHTEETREFPYGDERYGIPKRQDLIMDVLIKAL